MANSITDKRIAKELLSFKKDGVDGCLLLSSDHYVWLIQLNGPSQSLYDGQTFQLSLRFNEKYPFEAPEVRFVR
jgi:ubiquitin-conjugating enzyme E2 W